MEATPGSADPEQHLVNHVPDEVCVLVQARPGLDPSRVYEEVRVALNSALASELRQSQHAQRSRASSAAPASSSTAPGLYEDALSADLEPATLCRRFQSDAEILRPLERHGVSHRTDAADGVRRPWHILSAGGGRETGGRAASGQGTGARAASETEGQAANGQGVEGYKPDATTCGISTTPSAARGWTSVHTPSSGASNTWPPSVSWSTCSIGL